MNQSKLLQAGVIVVAFIMMMKLFESFIVLLFVIISMTVNGEDLSTGYYLTSFFSAIVGMLINLLIIRKSSDISSWLSNASGLTGEFRLQVNYQSLLSIILIAIGVLGLIKIIPEILEWMINAFTTKAGGMGGLLEQDENKIDWTYTGMKVLVYGALIYFAKQIAAYFVSVFSSKRDLEIAETTDELLKDENE